MVRAVVIRQPRRIFWGNGDSRGKQKDALVWWRYQGASGDGSGSESGGPRRWTRG